MTNSYFIVNNNPNLRCAFVDDATWSQNNWFNIDATATFLETEAECNAIVGMNDEEFKQNVILFPNPTNGLLQIENNSQTDIKKIEIYNTFGQRIYKSSSVEIINISEFQNVMYFVNIENVDGYNAIYKIIKN